MDFRNNPQALNKKSGNTPQQQQPRQGSLLAENLFKRVPEKNLGVGVVGEEFKNQSSDNVVFEAPDKQIGG